MAATAKQWSARKPRRSLSLPYLVGPPTKATIRSRPAFSERDREVLRACAEELGQWQRWALAERIRAGNQWAAKADLARLARELTQHMPARFAGTVALGTRQQYALAKRNALSHRQRLESRLYRAEQELHVLECRRAGQEPAAALAGVKVPKRLRVRGARLRVDRLERKLAEVKDELASGRLSITLGSKKLLKARHNLGASGYADEEEWRAEWQAERLFLASNGEARSKNSFGNPVISVDPKTGVCELALPKHAHFQQFDNTGRGRYRLDALISFSYRGDEWQQAVADGRAIFYRFDYKPRQRTQDGRSREGRWYIDATFSIECTMPLPQSLAEASERGVLSIDLNDGLLAARCLDEHGNPSSPPLDVQLDFSGLSSKGRETVLAQALHQICAWGAGRGQRLLALEDLDFADLKEDDSVNRRGSKAGRQKLHGIPTTKARHLAQSIAPKYGLALVTCDPAYTTKDGLQYWRDCGPAGKPLNRHQAGAIGIGRRGLRLKLRRRIRHPTGGSKQGSLESPVPHSDRHTGAEASNPERAGPRPVAAKSVRSGVGPAGRERSELPATAPTTAAARRLGLATGKRRPNRLSLSG